MGKSKHEQIAEKLAKKFGVKYKKHKGVDIVTKNKVIEVETTKNGIYRGCSKSCFCDDIRLKLLKMEYIKGLIK